ncbi:DEAD/DEAH box helicase family protein [Nocardia sp. NPDC051833]|uniref:DEAD/DEAH box helicase n=1 Tax=Nocardia sp. NPDC051833 TaxID=3155674 RepID=UPI003414D33B
MGNELTNLIVDLLRAQPNLSAPEIAEALAEPGVNRSVVNRVLYAEWAVFEQVGSMSPPRWALKTALSPDQPDSTTPTPHRAELSLRPWQQRALSEWVRNGRKGIVEAVGGTGKTVLGVRAVIDAVASSTPAVVLVADDAGRDQWLDMLAEYAPDCRVAGLGANPRHGSERTWQVAIVTASTITRLRQIASATQCSNALLVVDDLDRYAGGIFAQILTDQFVTRLALTRALDRDDQDMRSRLAPYFGPSITGCDYPTAYAEALLAPITVIQVGVELDAKERARLTHLDSLVEREYDTLIDSYGAPGKLGEFEEFVDVLATGRGSGAHHANRYLTAVSERATLLAECRAKVDLVDTLPAEILTATQTILFTERPVSASQVHHRLTSRGIPAATTATALSGAQRAAMTDRLHDRSLAVLVEQRVLDPTIRVPGAEIAILLSQHRNRTQLIQRLGRVLRPGSPPRKPLVVNVFVSGSVEDPSRDGASVLASIGSLAAETMRTNPAGLTDFLRMWQVPNPRSSPPKSGSVPRPGAKSEPAPSQDEARTPAPPAEPNLQSAAGSQPAIEPPTRPAQDSRGVTGRDSSSAESSSSEAGEEFAALLTELTNLGEIATGEEVGDLIGCTDPGDLRMLAEDAARDDRLVFAEIGGDSDDLLLLGTASHADPQRLRAAAERITLWADTTEDPIGAMYELMSDLDGVLVPPYRLVQIAAFLRGTTPKALL